MTATAPSRSGDAAVGTPLTAERLREWFCRFNIDHFGGSLPVPRLAVSHSKKSLGTYRCDRHSVLGLRRKTGHCIHVSAFYDCTEREYQDVLLHEMIHYYISLRNIRDDAPHGRRFREIMQRINAEGHRHISVTTRVDDRALSASASRPRNRLILALRARDGSCYLSVVNPRYAARIERCVSATDTIVEHSWHVSDDTAFVAYPVVRTARAVKVTIEEYRDKIGTMKLTTPPNR